MKEGEFNLIFVGKLFEFKETQSGSFTEECQTQLRRVQRKSKKLLMSWTLKLGEKSNLIVFRVKEVNWMIQFNPISLTSGLNGCCCL